MTETKESIQTLWQRLKELVTLKLEYTKITLAEKMTIILAMVALGLIAIMIGMIVVFFLSVALSHWLAESMGLVWSSLIVAAIYLVFLLVLVALRKQLFINPVSRFISKLML